MRAGSPSRKTPRRVDHGTTAVITTELNAAIADLPHHRKPANLPVGAAGFCRGIAVKAGQLKLGENRWTEVRVPKMRADDAIQVLNE